MPTFELRDFQVAELAAGAATWNEFGLNAVDNELTIKGFSFVDGSLRQKNFQGTNFNCSVRFEECHFPADTTFDRARFSDNCEFVRCTFSGALSFDNVAALANFALVDCRVEDDAQFLQIAAKMSFSLTRSHFRGSVQISIAPNVNPAFYAFGARFRKSFTLSGQVDSLDAESARFFRAVYLSSLRISQGALLIEAKFRSVVDFAGLSVGQTLCLDKAYFRRRLSLLDATITQSISAVSARFRGEFDCGSSTARTIPRVDLSSAHFYSAVSFENREFLGATIFEQAVFKHAPAFHNAKLFNGTYFTGAVFEDVKSEHAESCYRALRTACSEIDAFVDEQNFFALEARSRREHLSGVHQRLFDLYAWSSDWGRSVTIPLWRFAQLQCICLAIYALLSFGNQWFCLTSPTCSVVFSGYEAQRVFSYALNQALPIVPAMKDGMGAPTSPIWIVPLVHFMAQLVAIIQSVLSVILLFLAGLGLRNMFRLR